MGTILSEEEKNATIALIRAKPQLTVKEISDELKLPFECVRSIKAHVTMGSYDKVINNDVSIVDYEISLSMERDLQAFLLNDLTKIEPGLKLYEKGKSFVLT
jgi:hypothetical protein